MKQKSNLFFSEAEWFDGRLVFRSLPDAEIVDWLFEPGSLTERLRSVCGEQFRVQLLGQSWQKPFLGERRSLQMPGRRYALTREVLLCRGDLPLVCARTIIPAKTLRGAQRRLSNLGNRPLGEVLFASPKLERRGFELAELRSENWLGSGALKTPQEPIWGRRTVYSIGGHELLVCEFFLPALFRHD